ncbi:MAG: BadF/BadG/BcrA/BcrD ATPase family protein [Eubacteriales bacterium]|nr:BadF/BadG/BcrA/BcrD ATPase family protein [Eubacteriales bacterium]
MTYVFGIDGGGTRSRIRIADGDGRLIHRVENDSTNIYSVGIEAAQQNLRALMERACAGAGVTPAQFGAGCFGSAGLDRPAERELFTRFFRETLGIACPVKLCNDGEILLVGALGDTQGYCLIGGTGSLALARRSDGASARAGGLGYMLGDEGSACWIGWCAVRRALRAAEGRDLPTGMLPALMAHFHIELPGDFVALIHHHFDKPTVAAAARLVADYASRGDALAADICEKAAEELALLVESVVKRMPLQGGRLALSGGVMEHNPRIRGRLLELLSDRLPELAVQEKGGTAEEGAVLLALEQLA